jgi:hypothetical protein
MSCALSRKTSDFTTSPSESPLASTMVRWTFRMYRI